MSWKKQERKLIPTADTRSQVSGLLTRSVNEVDPVSIPEKSNGGRVDSDASLTLLGRDTTEDECSQRVHTAHHKKTGTPAAGSPSLYHHHPHLQRARIS